MALFLLSGCFVGTLLGELGDPEEKDPVEEVAAAVDVDVLLVVDNSDSMREDAVALAGALPAFATALTDAGAGDVRFGVTTTSVYWDDGASADVEPGEAGTLVGGGALSASDAENAVVCGATCWVDRDVPSDPAYECGDARAGAVTREYLDCECGVGAWQDHCGSGTEQGLEAAFVALCRAAESPPDACFEYPPNAARAVTRDDVGSNAGLDAGRTVVVVVSDEGDGSPRTDGADEASVPGEVDEVADTYAALYAGLGDVRLSVVGPAWDGDDGSCLGGAQTWGVERYQRAAARTGGLYTELTEGDECDPVAIEEPLAAIAETAGD